jgi:hypothetical protein
MKLLIGFATILCLSAVSAVAGDGRLSDQSLAKIGLGGMQVMSDTQGLGIRGLGVSEGMGGYGGYKHHHKDEGDKRHHEHHEKGCEKGHCDKEHCGHECHQACHPSCHFESLCHVQCGGGRKG